MAEDLADRLDDLICSFDKVIPGNFEGSVIFILAFWALAGFIVYLISVFVSKSVKEENEKKLSEAKEKEVFPEPTVRVSEVKNKDHEKLNKDGVQKVVVYKEQVDEKKPKPPPKNEVLDKKPTPVSEPRISENQFNTTNKFEGREEVIEDIIVPSVAYVCGSKKSEASINGVIPYSTIKVDPFVGEVEEEIIIPSFAYKCGDDSSPPPLVREEIIENGFHRAAPKCSGSDKKAVEWVNSSFDRLFEPFTLEYLKQIWIEDLNDYIKSLGEKVTVLITKIENTSEEDKCPIFANIVSQTHQRDNITVTADLNARLHLTICVQSPNVEHEDVYSFNVTKLRGRLSISILNIDRIVIFKLDGWPEIKTEIMGQTSDDAKSFVTEIVVSALRGTTITLDMDDFLEGTIFPIFTREKNIQTDENPPNSLFASGEPFFIKSNKSPASSGGKGSETAKNSHTLSVLVVKASGLLSTCHPFVILELDEPSQKFKTGLSQSLMWNEDFTLHLNPHSKEILFEVWDIVDGEEVFLGLGIVAIDELLIAPSQRHVIPLQGRPYASRDEDSYGNGLLTIQFILSDLNKDIALNRSFEQAASGSLKPSNSPLINEPKTILKNPANKVIYEDSEGSEMSVGLRDESPMNRSRTRKKRRLVSTLKKRITGRSFSIGSFGDSRDSSNARAKKDAMDQSRSISADRAYSLTNVNTLEGNSNLRYTNAISTSTFISEESSLVMEVDENNIKKYYFIPNDIASKEKSSLKGTKLHIFMDHLFVAKHIKRGKACEICTKPIPFRLKKQGYICRDCHLVCHKPCHIQVGTHCVESSLPAMDILHIKKDL